MRQFDMFKQKRNEDAIILSGGAYKIVRQMIDKDKMPKKTPKTLTELSLSGCGGDLKKIEISS